MFIFETLTFLSHLILIQLIHLFTYFFHLLVLTLIYKIYLSDGAFISPLSNHYYYNWKIVFFLFPWESLLGKQTHSRNQVVINLNYLKPENWSQTDRYYLKNCSKGISTTPLVRTEAITMGSKSSKINFLGFY